MGRDVSIVTAVGFYKIFWFCVIRFFFCFFFFTKFKKEILCFAFIVLVQLYALQLLTSGGIWKGRLIFRNSKKSCWKIHHQIHMAYIMLWSRLRNQIIHALQGSWGPFYHTNWIFVICIELEKSRLCCFMNWMIKFFGDRVLLDYPVI